MRVIKFLALLCLCALCSCSTGLYVDSVSHPYDKELTARYDQTKLKKSNSADVLAAIASPKYELLSQSKSVIASQGLKKKGHELWFNMVAFDENELTAKRKYFFLVDEKAENPLIWPKRRLVFDSEMVLEAKVLDEPYANENARRIAILKQVKENVRRDIDEVAPDNKRIGVCGMLINQTLGTVLQKLDESPVLASELSDPNGFGFDHITLGKGNIVMNVTDDIVKVDVKLGSFVWSTESPFALEE
ncbi:MAG: hypothetical protein WAK60_04855 [Sedimentisphaerales bacterium]